MARKEDELPDEEPYDELLDNYPFAGDLGDLDPDGDDDEEDLVEIPDPPCGGTCKVHSNNVFSTDPCRF